MQYPMFIRFPTHLALVRMILWYCLLITFAETTFRHFETINAQKDALTGWWTDAGKARCPRFEDSHRCPLVLLPVVPAMWCPVVTQTWLIFRYYGWMVNGLCWSLVVALWVAKYIGWSQSSLNQRKANNSPCSTLADSWCSTKHCKIKTLWARPWHSLALLFQRICTQPGVSSRGKDLQSLRESLFYRGSRRS